VNTTHPLQQIADSGATPMRAAPIPLVPRDDVMAGVSLAAEVLAYVKSQDATAWLTFAMKIIALNPGGRDTFIKSLRDDRKDVVDSLIADGMEKDKAQRHGKVFDVQTSRLATIAQGFNSGATIEGLLEYRNGTRPADKHIRVLDQVAFITVYDYCRLFKKAGAAKPMQGFMDHLSKFLETRKPDEADEAQFAQYVAVVTMYNELLTAK
jgi:hypothetical protein